MINFVYRKIRKFPGEKSAKKIINYFRVAEGAASSRCRAPPPPSPARTAGILNVQEVWFAIQYCTLANEAII